MKRNPDTGEAYSPATSRNQVPALFKWLVNKNIWRRGMVNLDIGGGKYDEGTAYAAQHGVENLIHDIGNRSEEHNAKIDKWLETHQPDTITISNVLNVIPTEKGRMEVLLGAKQHIGDEYVFILVHEGDKEDQARGSRPTSNGWQMFKPTAWYVPEVEKVFPYVERHGKVIVASMHHF